jgi:predicted transcriptional regulator
MERKQRTYKINVYIPDLNTENEPIERLIELGQKRDRSINYLVVEAILQYLDQEEARG